MTRQEEIRNAIDKIIPISSSRNGRTYEQSLMATGFEAGVEWADSNPKEGLISLSWVWHDSSEIPQHDALILFQSIYGDILLIRFQDRKSSMTTIRRWAYVDDLLPKTLRDNI